MGFFKSLGRLQFILTFCAEEEDECPFWRKVLAAISFIVFPEVEVEPRCDKAEEEPLEACNDY